MEEKDLSFDASMRPKFLVNTMVKEFDHNSFIDKVSGKVNIRKLTYDKEKLFESEGFDTCLKSVLNLSILISFNFLKFFKYKSYTKF